MLAQSPKRAASRLRSTLPMPRRGSSSTMCTSLGAAVGSSRAPTWVRNSACVGGADASAATTAATTRWPSRSSGTPNTAQSATRRMRRQHGFDELRKNGQPAGADRIVGPAQHPQHPRTIQGANVVGQKPARLGERVDLRRITVALGQRCTAERNSAVEIDPHPHSVQRNAVVYTTAGRFTHPVRLNHRNTHGRCFFSDASRHRTTTYQDGVQFRERGDGGVVGQRLVKLHGHQ